MDFTVYDLSSSQFLLNSYKYAQYTIFFTLNNKQCKNQFYLNQHKKEARQSLKSFSQASYCFSIIDDFIVDIMLNVFFLVALSLFELKEYDYIFVSVKKVNIIIQQYKKQVGKHYIKRKLRLQKQINRENLIIIKFLKDRMVNQEVY
ncbi:hypothetical protein ABPG72_022574 [Tetrahymena utriculariae]